MKYRRIKSFELELVKRILSTHPKQFESMEIIIGDEVEEIDSEGSIKFAEGTSSVKSPQQLFPVEAQFKDIDNVWIHALLYIVENRIDELEIYKDDSSKVLRMPFPQEWEIVDLSTEVKF